MKELKWLYPISEKELKAFLKLDNVALHSGGSSLLNGNVKRFNALIDLTHMNFVEFSVEPNILKLGASLTFTDVQRKLCETDPAHILCKALGGAASTPLRNRITLGGSIAAFPIWSDLMGPLIALDADLELIGEYPGWHKVSEYITKPELKKNAAIKQVKIKADKWLSFYHRETRTDFDYPAYTITLLMKKNADKVEDARVVIVGNSKKYVRLTELENFLKGKNASEINIDELSAFFTFGFQPKKLGTADYIKHLADTNLKRSIVELIRS